MRPAANDAPLRGLTRLWKQREPADAPTNQPGPIDHPATLVERVLAVRGVVGVAAHAFIHPKLTDLHDPGELPGVDRAAARLLEAADSGEPIVVFGDYDADGITASAIVVRALRQARPNADIRAYVPHRLEEGYGLNTEAINALADQGARVIVTVDCGITAFEPAAAAAQRGIDLIITDHHTPPDAERGTPDAYAVVHPALHGSRYPFASLCGAGVAFKLAWRLGTLACNNARVTPAWQRLLLDLVGLAALGTVADCVPLQGENRAITAIGLRGLRASRLAGVRALIDAAGLTGERVREEDIGFRLAPRLNAAGRLDHAKEAVELLVSDNPETCAATAERLCELNEARRTEQKKTSEDAETRAQAQGMTQRRGIVLASQEWHPGVVGIACSRLVERFGRPTLLLCQRGDELTGSGRSIDAFDLHAAIAACAEHLVSFGGHRAAAGLRLKRHNLDAFRDAFLAHCDAQLTDADLSPAVRYDTTARLSELTVPALDALERLAPFGQGNPSVTVRLTGLSLARPVERMGRTGEHARLTLTEPQTGTSVQAVAWGLADAFAQVPTGAAVEAVVKPKTDRWNDRVLIRPEVLDLRVV